MKKNITAKITALLLSFILILSLTACNSGGKGTDDPDKGKDKEPVETVTGYEVDGYERTDGIVECKKLNDGRYVDGYQVVFLNDTVSTAWFDFTVKGVDVKEEYDGYVPDEGYSFVIADITIKNTFGEDIDVFFNEFSFVYNVGGNEDAKYAEEMAVYVNGANAGEFFTVADTVNAEFIFQVDNNATSDFAIKYLEVYSDGVNGNDFIIMFK